MSDKVFLKNSVYRIVFPLVSGSVIYLMVLMVFDSLDRLQENFFNQEVLFTIVLSYCVSESFVALIRMLDRFIPFERGYRVRQGIQLSLSGVLVILVVSILVSGYFRIIVGYSSFIPEWIAFSLIFILFYLMINLYYLSHYNLYRHQKTILEKEQQMKINLDLEMETFKNDIHPPLLFSCLEVLIGLISRDKKEADEYIMVLSRQYRYILDHKKTELLELNKEIKALGEIIYLLNHRFQESIAVRFSPSEKETEGYLVPGTLSFLAEEIIFNNIINRYLPMEIVIDHDSRDTLSMYYRQNAILDGEQYNTGKMKLMNHSYRYYSGREIEVGREGERITFNIPILSLADEDSHS